MSRQREKQHGSLSTPSSLFQSRPPLPNNAVQSGVSPSSNAMIPFGAPVFPVAGFSRSPHIDHSQTIDVSSNQRPDQNSPNFQSNRSLAMFSGIGQVHIGVGDFSQNIYNVHNRDDNILKDIAFQLPRSCDAAFDAAINLDNLARRSCTPGTRLDVIAQIIAWINDPNAPPVYWLTGLAGMGKTTIAYTICEQLNEAQLPFASFFCSRQLDSKNSKLLVPTLCRDLAELYDSYAAKLLSVLETNSKAVNAGLHTQIDELLARPWQASIAQRKDMPTPIVIVDALDESNRGTDFLKELLRVIRIGLLTGIKCFVTSRLDPRIVDICKFFPPNTICKLHEVDTVNVQSDIERYLQEALPELKDEPELALLSQRAGGLFIFATTAVRFISPPYSPPSVSEMRSHLQVMLKPSTSHSETHERLLVDELYEQILGDAFRDDRVRASRLQILHTIICAESRIDMSVLANLTKTDQGTVKRVVESLHAVLFVSPKDGCVYWYHASFVDFLLSRLRAKISLPLPGNQRTLEIDVFCEAHAHHGVLSQRCFSIMQESLHFNMCNLPSSYVFDSEVPGLDTSIKETFSPTLRYVCRHWARHLAQTMHSTDDVEDLICGLKGFLCDKLLFWIEAMNLIGAKSECSSLLKEAELWAERGKKWPDLVAELMDATNFSAFFAGSPASKSTPHLYISALSMWNQNSATWRNWKDRFRIPSISLKRASITIPLMTIRMTGRVRSTAFSPDGNRIVSGSLDKSVRVWDAKTGELLMELQGHTDWVFSVAFSPDGNRIVSGSEDKSVRLWDAKAGEQLMELQGHTGEVRSVAFSPDGNRIVSGSSDNSVRVWHAKTGEQLTGLQGHTDWVRSVAFSPDGNRIVSGSSDNSVRVWHAKTGEQLMGLQGHNDWVRSVAFSPDGNRIVSGSDDESVRLWDAKAGEQLMELQGHTGRVRSVAFSADGNRIVSGSDDESVRVWDTKTGEQLMKLQGHTDWVFSVTFSPDGSRIVSCSDDRSVLVWDAKTGMQSRELQGHAGAVMSVLSSPDGNRIVSGPSDISVRVWDARTGEQLRALQGHTGEVRSVAFSPDGVRIVSGSDDRSVLVWDATTGGQSRELQGHTGEVRSVAFSPDGNRMVFVSSGNSVQVWDARTGEQLSVLQGHTDMVISIAFSPDGNQVVPGSEVRSVRVWDAMTGEQLKELQGHTDEVFSVSFSPHGKRIVSGSLDQSVRIWDAKTCEQSRKLQGQTGAVPSVTFPPDGNRILSGSQDESVRVWGNLNLDTPWVVDEGGWIISGAERLVWVPSTIRNVLVHPHNMLIISRNGSATISFAQCKFGTLWSECYTPSTH